MLSEGSRERLNAMFIEMGSNLEAPEDLLDHITGFKTGKCKGWHTFHVGDH